MTYVMTEDHKEALAEGRQMGRAVKSYLQALQTQKPRRGRRAATETKEGIKERLAVIEERLVDANPLQRLQLVQERLELHRKYNDLVEDNSLEELEDAFVKVAASYAERKGISYQAFRELGVSAEVLNRAGITRS